MLHSVCVCRNRGCLHFVDWEEIGVFLSRCILCDYYAASPAKQRLKCTRNSFTSISFSTIMWHFSLYRLLKTYWLDNKWFVRLMLIVPASTISAAFRHSLVNFIQHLLWESHGCLEVSHPRRQHLWWWTAFWWGREVKLRFLIICWLVSSCFLF